MKVCRAFAAGCGGRVAAEGQLFLDHGPAFFYGWTDHTKPLMDRCIAEGRTWFFADNGYFGRGRYFRVTRGALMHDGSGTAAPARFAATGIDIKPWKRGGRNVVIAAQSETFYRERLGTTRAGWIKTVAHQIATYSDRPIPVCDKPGAPDQGAPPVRFSEALADAWAVVSHSSNCLVEALTAGVPVFPLGRCAASSMGRSDLALIENPLRPEGREQWLRNLAANQWTYAEMEDGTAWAALAGTATAAVRQARPA